jgi:hypothetical protein
MTRIALAAAAALAAALLAGCSSHSAAPAGHASTAGTAAAVTAAPSGCASALAALPKSAPNTGQQAADDTDGLGGRTGTTVASLADAVAADSFKIGFDLAEKQSDAADVARWQADAKALRSYCS